MEWTIVKSNELTEEEKEMAKAIKKYPKIDNVLIVERDILKYKQIENPFYGIPLSIELKRDGSNLRLMYFGNNRWGLLSRNQYASDDFISKVVAIIKQDPFKYEKVLVYAKDNCVVYMELFGKGNSPTGFDLDSPPSLEVIDVYNYASDSWLGRYMYEDLPRVPSLYQNLLVANRDDYAEWIKMFLEYCDKDNREGIVIKANHPILGRIMTKEKVAKALEKPQKRPKPLEPQLPLLNISEINGAINKAHVELGEKIWEKAIAMPLVAKYIKEECKKHECSAPRNFYGFYLKYLEGVEK